MREKESSNNKEQIEMEKNKRWGESGECKLFREKLYETQEKTQEFFDNLSKFKEAFKEDIGESMLVCIDEGLNVKILENGRRKIRIAGAGMLMFEKMTDEQIKEFLDKNEIKKIITHKECGASGKHLCEYGKVGTHHTRCWAEKFKQKYPDYDMEYDHEFDHIHIKDMNRPEEFHDARLVYIDMVGGFDPSGIEEIPKGFVISGKAISKMDRITNEIKRDLIRAEAGLSGNIALGHHGFGERFNEKEPFLIVPIVSLKTEITETECDYKKIIEENELMQDRVSVRVIVAPKKK